MDNDLLVLLEEIAASQAEIHLMNVYKGVPLSFPAKIVGGSAQTLRVLTDRYQVVCMYIEKETFIQSKQLPQILGAKVVELDPAGRTADLAGFETVTSGIGSRMNLRVELEEMLEGKLKTPPVGRALKGELVDISQDGLGIYLGVENFSPREIFIGAQVSVSLTLPGVYEKGSRKPGLPTHERPAERFDRENVHFTPFGSPQKGIPAPEAGVQSRRPLQGLEVVIQGTVANTRREASPERYRVGVRISANDPSRPLIGQLIVQRQAEIIREIKNLYDLLLQNTEK